MIEKLITYGQRRPKKGLTIYNALKRAPAVWRSEYAFHCDRPGAAGLSSNPDIEIEGRGTGVHAGVCKMAMLCPRSELIGSRDF